MAALAAQCNECRDYPNPEYASYDECDNQFMRASLPGLTPVWMTENPAEATIQKDDKNGTYGKGRRPEKLLFFWILSNLPPPPFPLIWTTCTTLF